MQGLPGLAYPQDGMPTIQSVILATNKETKDFLVLCATKLIAPMRIEKWFSVSVVKSK